MVKENINDSIVKNLECNLGSKRLSREFKKVINKKPLNCEKIVAIALVPIVVKMYENDINENEKILVKKYGFNLYCETEKSTPMGYTYTFVFNDKEKIKSNMKLIEQQNIYEIRDMNEKEFENASLIYAKEYLDYEFNRIRTEIELNTFFAMVETYDSYIFNNKNDDYLVPTTKLKNDWKKNIRTSKQIDKFKAKEIKTLTEKHNMLYMKDGDECEK